METQHHHPAFCSKMIFELLDELLKSWVAIEGVRGICNDARKIRLLARFPEMTVGYPREWVEAVYGDVFLDDVWAELPAGQQRPGMRRCYSAEPHSRAAYIVHYES